MKTPITYYGGKQLMLPHILPLIPEHRIYVEPFAGGASVFFGKKPSEIEVLNDINGNISAFYRSMKHDFNMLNQLIEDTLHDEFSHKKAKQIYYSDDITIPDYLRGWAVWTLSVMSFASDYSSGWQFVKNKTDNWHPAVKTKNKRELFKYYRNRLKLVSIHNTDALEIILKRDGEDTFQYLDTPYVGARQGHYEGYTKEHFENLLKLLPNLKSKFLLSSYQHDLLTSYTEKYNWTQLKIEQRSQVSGKNFRKIEVLTFNYDYTPEIFTQSTIFDQLPISND